VNDNFSLFQIFALLVSYHWIFSQYPLHKKIQSGSIHNSLQLFLGPED